MEGRMKADEEGPGLLGMTLAFLSGQSPTSLTALSAQAAFSRPRPGPRLAVPLPPSWLGFSQTYSLLPLWAQPVSTLVSRAVVAGVTRSLPPRAPAQSPSGVPRLRPAWQGWGRWFCTRRRRWLHAARCPGLLQRSPTPASVLWSHCYLRTGLWEGKSLI